MTLADSHCHLDDARFDEDREAVIERALAAGVGFMLAIGTGDGPPDLEAGVRLAEGHEKIYATIGVHPHDARKSDNETWRRLAELAAHPKVVAIGEIGLDYYYDNSPRERQREVFAEQLRLARDAGKAVVIHTRDAWDDTMQLLREHSPGGELTGIMHCFTGGPEAAREALELGFCLSFGGVVTFPKASAVRESAVVTPLDRLLIETDAPYLAPVPHRGKRNEPAFVVETARKLAELRGEPLEKLARATTDNFRRLCLPQAHASE